MTTMQLMLSNIDDYLGPAETRFFSRGYQRARYDVGDVTVDRGRRAVAARANVAYPADWSRKQEQTDLRPHLSTIDALVLGVQCAEVELIHAHLLDRDRRRSSRLRKVTLRAGTAPQEELQDITISATWLDSRPQRSGDGWRQVSRHECRVGSLRVRTEIEHPAGEPAGDTGHVRHDSLEAALGSPGSRFYGAGFQRRRHVIEDVEVDVDKLTTQATARFVGEPDPGCAEGLDGGTHPSISLVDCFVVNLQLAQVLMYELDGIRRSESNTLWMMQTVLERAAGTAPLGDPSISLPVETAIISKKPVSLRGATWRTADLRGELGGVSLRSSFAHELPERAAQAAGAPIST